MASDFPSDLIRDIQIGLRHAAGIPSYDPDDQSLPSVPSIKEAVDALDPSLPDYLRCKRCHGGLCGGINSTLCIFCGAEQRVEGISRSISLHSTMGYRKFLQSLNLDGSEIVNFETESKDSIKGQGSPKSSMTLSNILDLELIWPRHVEDSHNTSSNKTSSQIAPASLSGINLNDFFSDLEKNDVSSRFNSSHDAYLPSVQSDTALSDTRNETAAIPQHATAEKVMPREQHVNPHISLSSNSPKNSFLEERSLDAANSSLDVRSGDLDDAFADWETDFQSASSVTFEAKFMPIDSFHNYADFQSANSAAAAVEPIQIDPFQSASIFQSGNPTDLFMESRPIDLFQSNAGLQTINFETGAMDSRFIDPFQKMSDSHSTDLGMVGMDFKPIDRLKSSGTENIDQSTNIGHNSDNALFNDGMSSHTSTKIFDDAVQLESISTTFVGEVKNENETPVRINWTDDDFWIRSSSNEINNMKILNRHDDELSDDWQAFSTSVNVLEDFSGRRSGDLEDLDFGSFVQSDSISPALDDLQSSSVVNSKEADDSAASRMNRSNENAGNASIHGGLEVSMDIPEASKYKLDMLLSQMPDLSFMLEESLCIPNDPSSSELNT